QVYQAVLDDPVKRCLLGTATFPCTTAAVDAEMADVLQFARQRGDFARAQAEQISKQQLYAFNERGGMVVTKNSTATSVSTGYGLIDPDVSTPRPDAVEIFSYRQGGVTVSETS